jgi:sucrose-6-phosphate hydrolase SacC (GH32 family)
MNDSVILDLTWNRQTVRDPKGNITILFRGKDYDLGWIKMGTSFAKFEKMIFQYENPCFVKLKKSIDFDTFKLVASSEKGNHYFKDKSNVYFKYYNQENIVDGADPGTFKVLDIEKGISADVSHYYYNEKIIPFNFLKATVLNDFYTISNGKVFFCFQEIEGADADSFSVIHENLGKDKNHVYFKGQIILEAHSGTFHLLEGCINSKYYQDMGHTFYARDKLLAYFIDTTAKTVKPIKSKSLAAFRFEVIDERGFGFDNQYRYYFGKRIKS